MEGFCRGCLIKYDEPMELLQYTEKNRRLFVYSTGLQVKRNDTFTFQLCKDCFVNMKSACKFKKLCRTSDKRFKNYLAIKDIGDPIDFCTFLKNSDDTLTFRLPMTSGNSTPANQKCRDDDNESTCTSIRNFMTDILQGEEMPDTEARIIREVIEEEADVLDDSLDSHWMQDDMSIDTDFRLDFNNFSPFSTPRSVNNDRCFTPKQYANEKEEQMNFYALNNNENKMINDFTNAFKNDQNANDLCQYGQDEVGDIDKPETHTFNNDQNSKDICDFNVADIDAVKKSESNAFQNNQTIKELCHFGVDQIDGTDTQINNIDMPSLDDFGIDKSVSNLDLPSLDSVEIDKSVSNIDMPNLDDFGLDKSASNIDMPSLDGIDKSVSNLDLPSLNGIGIDNSNNNINNMHTLDGTVVDKSISNIGILDGIGADKSMSNLDLPSLDSFGGDKSANNIDIQPLDELDKAQINVQNFYVPKDDMEPGESSNIIENSNNDSIDIDALLKDKPCTIDKNLEKALKNEDSKQFSLDDLLVSPPGFRGTSAASTPTIKNILFGEKLESPHSNMDSKLEQCLESLHDAQGDIEIFEEFFQNDTKEFDIEDIRKSNIQMNKENVDNDVSGKKSMDIDTTSDKDKVDADIEMNIISKVKKKVKYEEIDITTGSHIDKFDLEKFYCNLCSKKFKDVKALSIHFAKKHLIRIVKPKTNYHQTKLCNTCGKVCEDMKNFTKHLRNCMKKKTAGIFKCDRCPNEFTSELLLKKHKETHEIKGIFKCEQCPAECTTQSKLNKHMESHKISLLDSKENKAQKFVCTICGIVINKRGNYALHVRRHTNNFTTSCDVCGKGFYRASDLKTHMRQHTGDTPYACVYCGRLFGRKDVLNKHMRVHTNEKLYQCNHCNTKYISKSDLKRHLNTKYCLKKLGLIKEPQENMDVDTPSEVQVTVMYAKGSEETIRNQLPFLETEMSN